MKKITKEHPHKESRHHAPLRQAAKGKKVLVADDNPEIRDLYADMLGQSGATVLRAANGIECIEIAEREHPTLIFLDLVMPSADGYEVIENLKHNSATQDIKIVVLTNISTETDKKEALDLGADEYHLKTEVSMGDLLKIAENYT